MAIPCIIFSTQPIYYQKNMANSFNLKQFSADQLFPTAKTAKLEGKLGKKLIN